ncbi:MAG: AAA family ATPase [Nitrososphaerota archaeon]|nr:AAA family ATPase [Nitrososphaerota archaeon]MDG6959816.1 AAA family ATPase [Nitrososphaerota archaeon]MDG6961903.1 AAA family ATPase [Nitrososphaerota archaeon]MDG6987081.1 AAA family ATPase [Nitrososphaerota archaeon]MDG7015044.1 AAA family ATPase [Nitrososphaerota archaeon]
MHTRVGVKGVDTLLDGKGIPRGHNVLVLGAPGSGKTTFGLQYLVAGAKTGENGVYVSLDESTDRLLESTESLGLGVKQAVAAKKIAMVDASPIRLLPARVRLGTTEIGRKEFAVATLINSVTEAIKKVDAQRVVIDPISTLVVHYSEDYDRRIALLDLMAATVKSKCTTLLVAEMSDPSLERKYQFEEFIVDGVLILTRVLSGQSFTRVFSVEKMRGIDNDSQPHPYKISEGGIEVFPTEQLF